MLHGGDAALTSNATALAMKRREEQGGLHGAGDPSVNLKSVKGSKGALGDGQKRFLTPKSTPS